MNISHFGMKKTDIIIGNVKYSDYILYSERFPNEHDRIFDLYENGSVLIAEFSNSEYINSSGMKPIAWRFYYPYTNPNCETTKKINGSN